MWESHLVAMTQWVRLGFVMFTLMITVIDALVTSPATSEMTAALTPETLAAFVSTADCATAL